MPAIASIANINDTVVNFLSGSVGDLARAWVESGGEMTEVIKVWSEEGKCEKPWVSEKMTKKAKSLDLAVEQSIVNFLTVFGDVLFAESVWDTLTAAVYKRMVNALWTEADNQSAVKLAIKNTKPEKTEKKKSSRNKSAYLFCCQHYRQTVKEENPGISPQEVTKKLSEKWEAIRTDAVDTEHPSHELFNKFTQLAKEDKIRYELENPKPVKEKKEKKAKKPTNKRGKSAWVIFCEIKRPDACEKLGPNASNQDVMVVLGEWWASEDFTSVKMIAEERSLVDKERVKKLKEETDIVKPVIEECDMSSITDQMKSVSIGKEPLEVVVPAVKSLNMLLGSANDEDLLEEEDEVIFE